MISTADLGKLPKPKELIRVCKALSVLDAVLSQEWEFRLTSFNKQWADGEEFCEMRDGSGDHVLILFQKAGCVINGFAHELDQPVKADITKGLPVSYQEFIFGEPVKTIGTTFCIWSEQDIWKTGKLKTHENGSDEMLSLLEGNPKDYLEFAKDYYEITLPFDVVAEIYSGEPLTIKRIESLVKEGEKIANWELLKSDMKEIGFAYEF